MTELRRDDAPLWKPPAEFLRELPDLISGREPELLKPEARAWLLRDPRAREFALQISGAITMFSDLPERMAATTIEPISHRAKRSVQRAARQLPERLAEVMWQLITIEVDRLAATRGGRFIVPSEEHGSFEPKEATLFRDRDRLLACLTGEKGEIVREFGASQVARTGKPDREPSERARRLIRGFEVCLPSHSMITWSHLLVEYFEGKSVSVERWQSFAKSSWALAYGDHVLQTAALAFEAHGSPARALSCSEELVASYPSSSALGAASYSGVKSALKISDQRTAWSFVRHFARAMAAAPKARIHWQRQFLEDASEWRAALDSHTAVVEEMLSILGSHT